jgi:RNA 2',3'-cyclic 3'-phosphodiesterase
VPDQSKSQSKDDAEKRIRLFIAVDVPAELKARFSELQRELKSLIQKSTVRWTRSEQIHITLKFLGYVSKAAVPEIEASLVSAVASRSFQLSAAGLGCFPNMRSPRIIWAGLSGKIDALTTLQTMIETATTKWAEPEKREFRPHLTLGRVAEAPRRDLDAISGFIDANIDKFFGEWPVEQVDLMQSVLSPHGARYTCLSSVKLT